MPRAYRRPNRCPQVSGFVHRPAAGFWNGVATSSLPRSASGHDGSHPAAQFPRKQPIDGDGG
jgi:hypothetical protein